MIEIIIADDHPNALRAIKAGVSGYLNKQNSTDELSIAISDVGKVMGIKTIAEFVEDRETLSILNLIGIDYAQGFGIGKPAFFC